MHALSLAVLLLLQLALVEAADGNTALGCNAGNPGPRGLFFVDLVKTSLFGQPTIPGSQNTSTDPLGWPTQDFSLLFYNEPGGFFYPAADLSGTYTITALGCATVSIPPGFSGLTLANQSCPSGNLLAYLDISSNGDAVSGHGALVFASTTRGPGLGAGLTNVSLLLPGWPAGTDPDTLNPAALANLAGRCSITRFLGWAFYGHTQWDGITPPTPCDWSIRPRLGAPTYVLGGWGIFGLGVPYEIIARIVNAINSDVWLNVPSTSNMSALQEYTTGIVTLFDAMLPQGRMIYLEYANECMFGNNQCYQDNTALANASVFEQGDPYRLNYGLPTPPNASNLISHFNPRMHAYICRLFATLAAGVVGAGRVGRADQPGIRVVPLLSANGGYATDGILKLEWLSAAWGPPATTVGLATMNIGAYYGASRNVTQDPSATADEAIASLLANVAAASPASPTAFTTTLASYTTAAAYHGVALHAYEGGPDTSGAKNLMAFAQACVHPHMEDAVKGIVGAWQAWTGGTFNYFTLGAQPLEQPWGSYANLYDLRVKDTPKSRGLDYLVSNPPAPLTAGWPAPLLNHSASFFVGYYTPSGLPPTNPVVTWLPLNATMRYLVRFPHPCATGTAVTVYVASPTKAGGEPLEVSLGAFLPPVLLSTPPTNGSRTDFEPIVATFPPLPPAALKNGLVAVQLRVPVEGVKYSLRALDVQCTP